MILAGLLGFLLSFGLPCGKSLALGRGILDGKSIFGARSIRRRRGNCLGSRGLRNGRLLRLARRDRHPA